MKSLLLLWIRLAHECASWCCTSATMDCKTVHRRFEHEGVSFLTITLPTFGKDTLKCLDQGYVDRRSFAGFQRKRGLPQFLGGFLDLVFDRDSGRLLDDPNVDAILAIRQLTLMFNKLSLECAPHRTEAAMKGYIKCEQDVARLDKTFDGRLYEPFDRISRLLFVDAFTQMDREIYEGNHIPRHGPGATADRLIGNEKFYQTTWPQRLDGYFPMGDFLVPSPSYWQDLESVIVLEPESELPVRVISVPKTLKTPRIIGIEPTAMQYAQQALLPVILDGLAGVDYLRTMIGFDDQTPNQRMAMEGSLYGDLATLDLSEASDRVSNQHVRRLFRNHVHLHDAVDACRSRKADVPGHGVHRLSKFASMGSALCFPVEAMVFTTVIFCGIEKALNRHLSKKDITALSSRVRVYGDDIIVPVEFVQEVLQALEAFGFLVNLDKSFWNGQFRESCGRDYFNGEDVSIVRVRQVFPTDPQDATRVISLVSLRNQLYFAGYWQTCKWLDEKILELLRYFPVVLPSSRVLGRHSFLGFETQRMCDRLHSPLVKGWTPHAVLPHNPVDGSAALLKFHLKKGSLPAAEGHLERSGRPHAVNTKLRWCSPT